MSLLHRVSEVMKGAMQADSRGPVRMASREAQILFSLGSPFTVFSFPFDVVEHSDLTIPTCSCWGVDVHLPRTTIANIGTRWNESVMRIIFVNHAHI